MRFLRRYMVAAFAPQDVVENMNRQIDVVNVQRRAGRALDRVRHSVLHNKWVGVSLAVWITGLLMAFALPAPVRITPEKLEAYSQKARAAERYDNVLHRAQSQVYQHEAHYKHERGWLPWFASAEQKERIATARAQYQEVQADFQRIEGQHALAEREANKELGLFSHMGVSMAKANFWDAFERAKVIGRRNTFIDGIFSIIMNRENELIDIVAKLAFYLILNMGTAMFVMFWLFLFSLPKFVWSFGASWWEGTLFFVLAATSAASVMLTFMGLLTAGAGGVTYGMLRVAGQRRRIAPASDGRRRLQGQRVRGYAHVNLNGESYYRPVRQSQEGGTRQRAASAARQGSSDDHVY